ncbi:MAG: hypothetical protein ABW158_20595 [Candidatus Thiodiazotropha sp. 6PDIVS]
MKQTNLDFNLHANDLKPEKPSRPSPFCLRLSREERALLERAAGDLPLGTYIRKRLLNDAVASRRKVRKKPFKDKTLLAQALAELGRSRLSSNLNQIAKAIHTGTLILTPDVRATLLEACADIQAIRTMLMKALGLDG